MIETIYIKNQYGEEMKFKVEAELARMYEVFHKYGVTHIDKSLVYQVVQNGNEIWKYPKTLQIPEDVGEPVQDYFVWGYNITI